MSIRTGFGWDVAWWRVLVRWTVGRRLGRVERTARKVFGWSRLRPGQLQAIRSVLDGTDTLVVMPTGAGKSAIYQIAALLIGGPTVVVSPLVALQRDQVAALAASGAPEAVSVNSSQSNRDSRHAWEALAAGTAEFLFLTPEQLAKDEVIDQLAEHRPSLLVVDEAHCVSSWGHDFRPEYLRIEDAVGRLGHPRVVALTATASPPVRAEIVTRLGMRDAHQVIAGFDRPNLFLEVRRFDRDEDKRRAVVERVMGERRPGLVYVATRRDAERYAESLAERGLTAAAYHAGMPAAERTRTHQRFTADELDVVVATSAFGMGIDKPNVRFVLHAAIPDSLDSYYQEIGRAGRDGEPANAILLYRPEDLGLQRFHAGGAPDEQALAKVARSLRRQPEPVGVAQLKDRMGLSATRLIAFVNLLEQAGAVRVVQEGRLEYRAGGPSPARAVERAMEIAETHRRVELSRVEMMREYADTLNCRRQFLLGYFGERLDLPCGNCDTCRAGTAYNQLPIDGDGAFRVGGHVRHREFGTGTVMRVEADRLTVLFDEAGYKTLSLETIRDNRLLTKA
jgi:ATP-dependent DNA helicase RecQ